MRWITLAILVIFGFGHAVSAPMNSMLGADGNEVSDPWEPTAADYIQDGLIAMWDGIENLDWGQHDPDATVFHALVGGLDLMIPNGAVFVDNGLLMDRRKKHTSTAISNAPFYDAYADAVGRRELTFEVVYSLYEYGDYVSGSLSTTVRKTMGPGNEYGLLCPDRFCSVYINSNTRGLGYYWNHQTADPIGTHSLAATYSPSGNRVYVTLYLDGVPLSAKILPTSSVAEEDISFSSLLSYFYVGSFTTEYPASVDVNHAFRIYDRTLSAWEIYYNYIVDKMRFGL